LTTPAIGVERDEQPAPRPRTLRAVPQTTRSSIDSPLGAYLGRLHDRYRGHDDGIVATYIPELGKADPSWFGIAAATLDGSVRCVGDADQPFTIQSISKPLTYGLLLDDLGEDAVRARIGVEPTGDAFNSILLSPATGLPLNPMVNAGAIAASGLAHAGERGPDRDRLLERFGAFVGHPLSIDRAVLASERQTGHRNRAIAHLLRASGALEDDPDDALEAYFAQCSVVVTATDLAVIAGTLANGGVNPLTGARVLSPGAVRAVLSVMSTCGMYDGAGEWMYTVGLPAKSGVSGGILAVVPGRLGIGVFSPPLDPHGNSVRGVRVSRDVSRDLGLHALGSPAPPADPIRATYTLAQVGSKRRRRPGERAALIDRGDTALVLELQGALTFLAADGISNAVDAAERDRRRAVGELILDIRRVERIDESAMALIVEVLATLDRRGIVVTLAGRHRHPDAFARIERDLIGARAGPLCVTDDLDTALEWAEERLLGSAVGDAPERVPLEAHEIAAGLDQPGQDALHARLRACRYRAGDRIVALGEATTELYLVLGGRLSVSIEVAGHGRRRLTTLGPGMSFGELSLFGGAARSADVHADSDVECLVLDADGFDALAAERPEVSTVVLRNLLHAVSATATRLTQELAVVSS
jgi:glutaminase